MRKNIFYYILVLGFITGLFIAYFSNTSIVFLNQNITYGENIDINNLHKKAKNAYYNGKFSRSEELYQQIIQYDNSNIEAMKNLIIIYKELGQFNEVTALFKKLINRYPDNLKWQYKLGVTYYQTGKYEKGLELLLHVYHTVKDDNNQDINKSDISQLAPGEHELLNYYLGKCLQATGKIEQALKLFNEGINQKQSFVLNYIGKAEIFSELEQYEKSNLAYEKALDYDSSLSLIYPKLALNYERLNQPRQAYIYWKKSLDTGNKAELAHKRIEKIEENYPEFKEEEEEIKKRERADINWLHIEPVEDVAHIPVFRVGLLRRINNITLQAGSSFTIKNKTNGNVLLTGEAKTEWKIEHKQQKIYIYKENTFIKKIESESPLVFALEDRSSTFVLYNVSYGRGYFWAGTEDRHYRGKIELMPVDENKLNVINIINLEEYLLSVVPSEMPAWWPQEALKAQSIAARSYAIKNRNRHQHEGFDLCATVHCAVYRGVTSEHERTTAAVKATKAEVATYNDKIINAVFSSNSGGYTESSFDVWNSETPYLSGVNNMLDNNYNFPLEPFKLKQWLQESPPAFSKTKYTGTNNYRWTKIIPMEFFIEKYNIKEIENIIPLERSKGGSIKNIKIIGDNNEIIIEKDSIRSALGGLRSNRFYLEKIYDEKNNLNYVILHGSGWGHNVGLDQTAAAGMVEHGYNYKDIIYHFYPGTKIEKYY